MRQFSLDKARAIYQATKHLQFSDIRPLDLKDRLALATVAAGLRPVGVLEGDGLEVEGIREQMVNLGLYTAISKSVWSRTEWPSDHHLLPFLPLFDEYRKPSSSRVLWFCANAEDRKRIKTASITKQEAGLLLGYPECCVQRNVEAGMKASIEFLTALIAKVGRDEQSLRRAFQNDVGVEMEGDVFSSNSVPRTDAEFPFAIHVACDTCLGSKTSPTALFNASYEKLAFDLDPQLHDAILEIRELCANLKGANESKRSKVLIAIEEIYQAAVPVKRRTHGRTNPSLANKRRT